MLELKFGEEIELLIQDKVYRAKVTDISTRETSLEFFTYYTLDNEDKKDNVSISISTKRMKDNDRTL